MSEANKRQVAGTHYQTGGLQHWDLCAMYGWDYFQGQITKYVMRWKTKHPTPEKRLDDLKKARHFIDKYIEEVEKGTPMPAIADHSADLPMLPSGAMARMYLNSLVRDRIAPSAWVGFTFEGDKENMRMFRCNDCRAHFALDECSIPCEHHECGEADAPAPWNLPSVTPPSADHAEWAQAVARVEQRGTHEAPEWVVKYRTAAKPDEDKELRVAAVDLHQAERTARKVAYQLHGTAADEFHVITILEVGKEEPDVARA